MNQKCNLNCNKKPLIRCIQPKASSDLHLSCPFQEFTSTPVTPTPSFLGHRLSKILDWELFCKIEPTIYVFFKINDCTLAGWETMTTQQKCDILYIKIWRILYWFLHVIIDFMQNFLARRVQFGVSKRCNNCWC